jgi:hypothetical protein
MNKLRINALLACLMLALGSSVLAADPPKEPAKDAKKEEEKPAEPDLPSKPFPKNAVPKAFLPKKDEQKEAAAKPDAGRDKPAEKAADKQAEKPAGKADDKHGADKTAVVKFDGGHDQPAPVAVAPKRRKVARAPAATTAPAANPVIQQVAGESVKTASADRDAYVAQKNDTLDKVIAKTFPKTPFSMEIMREAFVRANPQLRPPVKNVKLNAGQVVQLPDVNVMRMVVMGGSGATMAMSGDVHYEKKQSLFIPSSTAPAAVAPAVAVQRQIAIPPLPVNVASAAPTQEVSAEEKKKWVRFP